MDQRSFDGRFGIGSREATIDTLVPWCLGYRELDDRQQETAAAPFGFVALFLLTLLSLTESEARRSVPHPSGMADRSGWALTHDCDGVCGVLIGQAALAETIGEVYSPQPPPGQRRAAPSAGLGSAVQEWQAMEWRGLRFHRHGSTSIILRGSTARSVHGIRPSFALKLILYPFTRIQTIAHATREYAEKYDTSGTSARHLVHIWASFDSWILMDFVAGRTLTEIIHEESVQEDGGAGTERSLRLDRLRSKGLLLFEALEELQRIAREDPQANRFQGVHADLSPSNIIVADADGAFKLIDLGRNYLYTHAITGTTSADAAFIAPEVRAGDHDIARADLYSLGQLLIFFGCGRGSADGIVPDIFYVRAMLLARFLEDLIDASPARRLLIFTPGDASDFSFARLKDSFLAELEMVQAAEEGTTELRTETGWRALRELVRPLAGAPGREWRLWRMRRQQGVRGAANGMPFTNWLLAWSFLAAVIWAITNATVITWLLRDLNLSWGNHLVDLAQHVSHRPGELPIVDRWRHGGYTVPDWRANLPERMVGLSYAIAAPKYYEMLFSGLTPLVLGRRAGRTSRLALGAETIMRIMAVAPCTLVMTATLVDVRWWPINSAIGQCITAVSNYLTLAFIQAVVARSRQLGLSTVARDDTKITGLLSFSQWAPTSLFYAVIVLTIGSFLYAGVLHDEWVYALAVTATNIFLFYVIKCGIGGPTVRITMVRACLAAERVGRCA
ncbi:hypothetical protein [Streptomyces odontomachi]|uniref:hypothetical protein n=1 Tax=Streptomyces odontomachi TaxID=2944940 RepID=UPI0021087295|nr:hypothetical protein [Streptomyces sp. ODS25]